MRNLLTALFLFTFFACDNTFDLIEERKDIPVVYGLISPVDTAQYIRVERAFVDEKISPLELSQNPDLFYYDEDIVVKLVQVSTEEEFVLDRVDGNLEGYIRQDGAFANSPNILYKILNSKLNFVEGQEYRLEIERGDQLPTVTATTSLLKTPKINRPSSGGTIDFSYARETAFQILGNETCFLYNISLEFYYRERDNNVPGSEFESKSLLWSVAKGIQSPDADVSIGHEETGINFYNFLVNNIDEGNFSRQFEFIDVIVEAGGEEILEYNSIGLANLGITSSQEIPTYTNLSEGQGVFSSRTRVVTTGLPLSPRSLDSLSNGNITGRLNF